MPSTHDNKHVWSRWSDWESMGNGQDSSSRHCIDRTCNEVQTKYRKTPEDPNKDKKKRKWF